jgi:hypothetical protein
MIPLGHGGKNLTLEIFEDSVEALTVLGRGGRKRIDELAGLQSRQHGNAANIAEVLGNPVYAAVRGAAKVFDVAGPRLRVFRIGKMEIGQRTV